ncbi:CGNR zinc finger domain-containing protein [Tsukamurella soli]|uniref:ABATE domain-containing protein n=1 Tax=Tsukamurella soli TaxID=644556 RepID=A0ABP8K8R0_9ACTN
MAETDPPVSLKLVGTIHGRFSDQPTDDLTNPDTTSVWLRNNGFPTVLHLTDEEVADLRALRQAIFDIFTAQTTGAAQHPAAVAELNRALGHGAVALASVDPQAPDRLIAVDAAADRADAVLYRIAADALALTTGPHAHRVRQCTAHTCGTFFVDTSRAGNRKWCSAATCGNRARVAAHRTRARDEVSDT